MADKVSNLTQRRSNGKTPVERLLAAIGYPVRVSEATLPFTLLVDGGEIVASDARGALRLTCRLTDDAAQLPRLAEYAAGRMLMEDPVLSYGSPDSSQSAFAFLWQDIDGDADERTLRRSFEAFADSCDWWRSRLEAQPGANESPVFPEMMIRP